MDRRGFLGVAALAASTPTAAFGQVNRDEDAAVRRVVQRYVDAREAREAREIEPILAADADQLVSDGTWRKGRDELVKGMLESSRRNPAKRTIIVESVRFLSADVSLVDGRYVQKAQEGGSDRVMWTAITLKKGSDGWRIAAIRNMLPAAQ
jgi:uncharacterized protein (TIGR02246 family)